MEENHMVRRIWRVCYPAGVYLLISNAVTVALVAALSFGVLFHSQHMDTFTAIDEVMGIYLSHYLEFMLCGAIVTIPVLALFMHMDTNRKKRSNQYILYEKPKPASYLVLILLGAASCIGGNSLIELSGLSKLSTSYEIVAELLYSSSLGIELLVIGLVVPIAEELVFRGLVFNRLKEILSPVWAILLSALAFGVFHGNLVQGIYAFLLGLFLAYSCERYKTVLAPIILHSSANIVSVILTETTVLDFIYQNMSIYILITMLCVLITAASCIVIGKTVNLKGVIR